MTDAIWRVGKNYKFQSLLRWYAVSFGRDILTFLQVQAVFLECVTLKMEALQTSETSGTIYALT